MSRATFDSIVIGGGHNGLVAGFYLSRAGQRVLVLERRPFVGGACNTEEFAPGFRASTGAYVLSMLRRSIWRDMQLARRGIVVDQAGPTLNLYPDGAHYYLGEDSAENVAETRRFSERRRPRPPAVRGRPRPARPGRGARVRLDRARPADPLGLGSERPSRSGPASDCASVVASPTSRTSSRRARTSSCPNGSAAIHVKAALGWHAINDSVAGPSTPGTAYVLLHDHASEEAEGGVRHGGSSAAAWAVVTATMADAAREVGCEIRCDAEVEGVLSRGRPRDRRQARERRGDRSRPACSRTPIRSGRS